MTLETHDAFENMALDEAILEARIRNSVPNTVRFYRWKPSAVSIGKFQDITKEVQLDNCQRCGVNVVRRMTGGGSVYHDRENEITYSVVARKEDLGSEDIVEVYVKIYAGLMAAVQMLGARADFSKGNERTCPNVTINGKKISGSAQAHKRGVVLQHGTLLLKVNFRRMFMFLRVPWADSCMQVVSIARNRITSLDAELGKHVSMRRVNDSLIRGFEKALGARLVTGALTASELEFSRNLCSHKYATDEWNINGKTVEEPINKNCS